ncbi:MAG: hypothetical protein IJ677_08570 [Alphaproteobacteria bacterium]|nr:hypothetical protein [Alphaproteobacteria bacterium]
MKKFGILCFVIAIYCVAFISPAFAAPSGGDEIWTKLADKASSIGVGLQSSGFIIGGIGLVFFSFMAIFNKISWKNLAYIMLSCFVLSAMVAIVNYFSFSDEKKVKIAVYNKFNGPDGEVSFKGGVAPAGGTMHK